MTMGAETRVMVHAHLLDRLILASNAEEESILRSL